jgi:O-antigen ligase
MRITETLRGNWNIKGWKGNLPHMDLPVGVTAGVLIGLFLLIAGPLPTIGLVLLPILLVMLFKAPELLLLAILVYTSGLIPSQFNPYINLGVGHFQVSDLILISLLGVAGFRIITERGFQFRKTPLDWAIILYCLAVFWGIYTSVTQYGTRFSHTTYEARIMLTYSVFFAVTQLLRKPEQLKRLLIGIFTIGLILSALLILQVSTGFNLPIVSSSYFRGDTLTRAYHPGFYAVFITMMMLVSLMAARKIDLRTLALWLAIFMLGLSITISLGRNIVFSTLIAIGMLAILLRESERRRLILSILVIVFIAVSLFGILSALYPSSALLAYPRALMERLLHLVETDPLSPDETLLWRIEETGYAWQHIAAHPFVGIGLFNPYRPPFFEGDTLRAYIHNGYLWVWLKTGLMGLLPFLFLIFGFVMHGFLGWKKVQDPFLRSITLGASLIIFAMAFSNFVAPVLIEGFNLAFFAVTIGIGESILAMKNETL